jgi:hypothetical protein
MTMRGRSMDGNSTWTKRTSAHFKGRGGQGLDLDIPARLTGQRESGRGSILGRLRLLSRIDVKAVAPVELHTGVVRSIHTPRRYQRYAMQRRKTGRRLGPRLPAIQQNSNGGRSGACMSTF